MRLEALTARFSAWAGLSATSAGDLKMAHEFCAEMDRWLARDETTIARAFLVRAKQLAPHDPVVQVYAVDLTVWEDRDCRVSFLNGIDRLNRIIAKHPACELAYRYKGHYYRRLDSYEEAESAYTAALKLKETPQGLTGLGCTLEAAATRPEIARSTLIGKDPRLHYRRALVLDRTYIPAARKLFESLACEAGTEECAETLKLLDILKTDADFINDMRSQGLTPEDYLQRRRGCAKQAHPAQSVTGTGQAQATPPVIN